MDRPYNKVVSAVLARLAALFLFGPDAEFGGILGGLWDGVHLHRSLQKTKSPSLDPYILPALTISLDFILTYSPIRALVGMLGCVLGMLLADVGPAVWKQVGGFRGFVRELNGLRFDITHKLFARLFSSEGSRHTSFIHEHRAPSGASSTGSTTTVTAMPSVRNVSHAESVLDIPGSFHRATGPSSTLQLNTPRTTFNSETLTSDGSSTSSFERDNESDGPRSVAADEELEYESDHSTPLARPTAGHPVTDNDVPPIGEDIPAPGDPPTGDEPSPPASPRAPTIPDDENVPGPSSIPHSSFQEIDDIETATTASTNAISDSEKGRTLQEAKQARLEAGEAIKQRDGYLQQKKVAERDREPFEALILKLKAEEADELAKKCQRKAEKLFYKAHNMDKDQWTIDVHDLKPPEAIRRTERMIRDAKLGGGHSLKVIIGRGRYAAGKIAVLKLAIINELSRQRIPVEEDQSHPGVLNITIS